MTADPLEAIINTLLALDRSDLAELHAIIGGLLEATDKEALRVAGEKRGTIEWKKIPDKKRGKEYGPYPYLRYWKDGKLKSKYLKNYRILQD